MLSKLDEGVAATGKVGVGLLHVVVGVDAELGALVVGVVDGAGRETDAPSAGQLAGEGHAGAASCAVAHDGDPRAALHILHKLVGRAEHAAVGEHHHVFLPAYAA